MNSRLQPLQAPLVENRLLRALPIEVFNQMLPQFEEVVLAVGERIVMANEPIPHAYFIESGLASVTMAIADRGTLEVAVVGRDGMVSTALVLGIEHTPLTVEVRVPGRALRIGAGALRQAMAQSSALRDILLRYVQVVTLWTSQMALANRHHSVEERLALCLLLASDRLDEGRVIVTHEMLALMLGMHRPRVTVALHELERTRMIVMRRGQITIRDRSKLVDLAGSSYGLAEAEYERLIGPFI